MRKALYKAVDLTGNPINDGGKGEYDEVDNRLEDIYGHLEGVMLASLQLFGMGWARFVRDDGSGHEALRSRNGVGLQMKVDSIGAVPDVTDELAELVDHSANDDRRYRCSDENNQHWLTGMV